MQQLNDRVSAGQDALSELRFGLLPHPEANAELEARAMEHLRERFRRRTDTTDEPPSDLPGPTGPEQDR